MKGLIKNFFSLIFTITILTCSNDADDKETNVIDPSVPYQELDISYGSDAKQKFDLYLPAKRSINTKTMILIHGGGWSGGDKAEMNAIKDLIRQDLPNLAIVNINYRLADNSHKPYPMQIDDITTIINYIKDHSIKYSLSQDFGFIGISAGGHLSLLWSYAFDIKNNIKMVCSIVGPTNLTDPAYLNSTDPNLNELLGLFGTNPEPSFLEEVSPYHRVKASAASTILFYGGKDPLIPVSQGVDLNNKLQNLGVTHEFILYPNAGHGWLGLELLDTWTKLKLFTQVNLIND